MPPAETATDATPIAFAAFQAIAFVLVPAGVLLLARRFTAIRKVGAVVVCYALGILVGNLPGNGLDGEVSMRLTEVSVVLAIPLLLFPLDVLRWLRMAGKTAVSFGLCIVSVLVVASTTSLLLGDRLEDGPKLAGMIVGVYTGGTANMAAIGTALGVPAETFVLMNTADIAVTAPYLFFLMTLGGRLFGRLLPPFPFRRSPSAEEADAEGSISGKGELSAEEAAPIQSTGLLPAPGRLAAYAKSLGLAVVVVALSLGVSAIAPEGARDATVMLGLTTFAIAASLLPRVRALTASSRLGDYFLLVFCFSMGSLADAGQLLTASPVVVGFVAVVVIGSVLVHLLLARLARIDCHTMIITSSAAVFGPAFIGPVAAALGNREIVISGMTTALFGFAIGNYLGIGLAWMLS
jgi:uncharacterized membrane protein